MLLVNQEMAGRLGAVTLSASYVIGDVAGTRHSLHLPWCEARVFHGSYAALVTLAAAVTLIPGVPLGIATTGVQALAGVLLPSALPPPGRRSGHHQGRLADLNTGRHAAGVTT